MNSERWVENVFRPLIVGAMVSCIALSLVDLIQLFFPAWSGVYMVVVCFLAAVEANYSYRTVRRLGLRGSDVVRFRVFEVAVLFVLVRVGSMVGLSWPEVWAELRIWPREPWRVLDLEVIYASMLALLSWAVSTSTTHDLQRIGEPPVRDKYYVYPMDALMSRFFRGGLLLLLTAGITRIGISELVDLRRPSVPGLVLNVLVYFALGLAMLGQIHYAQLSQRWRKAGIDAPGELPARWVRYTLVLIGLAGVIAFLLPAGYALPLLDVISIVLGAVLYVLNVVFQLAILLFFLLTLPLALLLGIEQPVEPPPGLRPPPQPPVPQPGAPAPGWFEVVRSVAFWIVAIGLVVVIVRSYLRDRPELTEALTTLQVYRALRIFACRIWRRLTGLAGAVRARVSIPLRLGRPRRKEEQGAQEGRFRFLRIAGLSRRDRTLYYYLSILRRAARQGYPRDPSQTPYEYDADLGPAVGEAQAEMDRLTDVFVEARYSTHPIEPEQERRVRVDWKRIRAALRSLRRSSPRSGD